MEGHPHFSIAISLKIATFPDPYSYRVDCNYSARGITTTVIISFTVHYSLTIPTKYHSIKPYISSSHISLSQLVRSRDLVRKLALGQKRFPLTTSEYLHTTIILALRGDIDTKLIKTPHVTALSIFCWRPQETQGTHLYYIDEIRNLYDGSGDGASSPKQSKHLSIRFSVPT